MYKRAWAKGPSYKQQRANVMTNFETALRVVFHHEGGFVDNPADKGGPTKYGITAAALAAFLGPITPDDIPTLTEARATAVYHKQWTDMRLDEVHSSLVSTVLFDQAVLDGTVGAILRMQTVLGIATDGRMGTLTLAAINCEDAERLAFRYVRASVHYYTRIVEHDSTQAVFLGGWIDRLMSLLDFTFLGDFT